MSVGAGCPADGDGKCYKQDAMDPPGTYRQVCCPMEKKVVEEVAPWCGKVLDMGKGCYRWDDDDWEWYFTEDCRDRIR
jgi:hypothetical protein